jgi:hypothetical protein
LDGGGAAGHGNGEVDDEEHEVGMGSSLGMRYDSCEQEVQ